MWYWLQTTNREQKNPYGLMGPFNSHFEAQKVADKLDVDSEVIELGTRNLAKATQLLKAKIASEDGQFKKTTRNWKHKPPKSEADKVRGRGKWRLANN